MKLLDLITSPWAIQPEKLVEIQAVYAAHIKGEAIDIAAIEARLGRQLASEMQSYTVDANGVATLEVNGVMAPKANLFMQISGGVSTQMLAAQFDSMRADARVRSSVTVWDSPGGQVLAVPAAAKAFAALSAEKPTVSLVRGAMASAAYWVGSAANAIYLEGETDIVGSLGVYQRLSWDSPTPNTMDMVRGKYKRLSVNGGPPDPDVIAAAEAQLDYLYSVLIDAVAANRRVSADAVLQHMADGRIFTGRLAIDSGLADGISTLADITDRLAAKPGDFARRRTARIAVGATTALASTSHGEPMNNDTTVALTREDLERNHAGLFAALRAEFTAAGAAAERARIQGVEAACLPGHEALIQSLKFDGKTDAGAAALAVMGAERQLRERNASAIANDAPKPVASVAAPAVETKPADPMADTSKSVEERCKAKWEADAGIRAEFTSLAAFTAMVKAEEGGKVRVLSKHAAA